MSTFFGLYDARTNPITLLYSTTKFEPTIDPPNVDRRAATTSITSLDGSVLNFNVARDGYNSNATPDKFTLTFEIAQQECYLHFLRALNEKFLIGIRLDHRWNQLAVTANGLAVTVTKGYVLSGGDVYYLFTDTTINSENTHTKLYGTPTGSTLTLDTGTSVPSGSILIADITTSASAVTVGTQHINNVRYGIVDDIKTNLEPMCYYGFQVIIKEVI